MIIKPNSGQLGQGRAETKFPVKTDQPTNAEQKLAQRVKELTAINRLAREVTANLSLKQVVAPTYQEIRSTLNPDLATVFLKQENNLTLQDFYPEHPDFFRTGSEELSVGQCLCGLAVSDQKAEFAIDIHNDPRCTLEECKNAGIRSFAAIPLVLKTEILGVLGVGSRTVRDFSDQADLLETLASQVAIGLKNAILYEQVQRYSAQLDQQVKDLMRSRTELQKSEERYRNLYESSPDGTISALNPAFEKITGWSTAEWIGRPFTDILHPDDVALATQGFDIVKMGETTPAAEMRVRAKSGEILTGNYIAQPEIRHGRILHYRFI